MQTSIVIRKAQPTDRNNIMALSPQLSEVAELSWHSDEAVSKFQDDYIAQMLDHDTDKKLTLIAEDRGEFQGFIHACERRDDISNEVCGTIPLLAVSPTAQGRGIGKLLIDAAEEWSRAEGHRLLHLEVFANNENAQSFYRKQGFLAETLVMIKPLGL